MTAAVLTLHRLAYATTTEEAQAIAREALASGVPYATVLDALIAWDELRQGDVQTVRGEPLCRCGHLSESHQPSRRLCHGTAVCACAEYRPKGEQ